MSSDLDWGEFFRRLGEGAMGYGELRMGQADRDKDRALRERQLSQSDREQDFQEEQLRLERIRRDRQDLLEPAQHRWDAYARQGVYLPPDFIKHETEAGLPQTGQAVPDPGSLALDAVRNYGQARVDETTSGLPDAINQAWKKKDLATSLPGGGSFIIDPTVRASLENADATRQYTKAYRQAGLDLSRDRLDEQERVKHEQEQADEQEGMAAYSAVFGSGTAKPGAEGVTPDLQAAFGRAVAQAQQATPGISTGRAAKKAYEGLKGVRQDLFPGQKPKEDEIDKRMRLAREAREAAKARGEALPTAPTSPDLSPDSDRPGLAPADIERARTDPEFRSWLISKGYTL